MSEPVWIEAPDPLDSGVSLAPSVIDWVWRGEAVAAAYAFGIARNHPFVDGNKRVAWAAALTFLRMQGLALRGASEAERIAVVADLAAGTIDEALLAAWLSRRTFPIPPGR